MIYCTTRLYSVTMSLDFLRHINYLSLFDEVGMLPILSANVIGKLVELNF